MSELPNNQEPEFIPARSCEGAGGFRAAFENAITSGGPARMTTYARVVPANAATTGAMSGKSRLVTQAGTSSAGDWVLRQGVARRGAAATTTGADELNESAFTLKELVEMLVSYKQEVNVLNGEVSRLANICESQAAELLEVRADAADATKAASGMARLADWAFWAIVLLGGGSAILLVLLAANALLPVAVAAWLPWIVGFVGLAGALAVLAYLRKLGKLDERVKELEQQQADLGGGGIVER